MLNINASKCTKCGLCARHCPWSLFTGAEGQFPELRANYQTICSACGHCLAVCPTAAIEIAADGLAGERGEPLSVQPSYPEFAGLVKNRRSTRYFRPDELPQGEILEMLAVCQYSPSAKNLQPVKWLVVSGRDRVADLSAKCLDWLIDQRILPASARERLAGGYDVVNRGAPHLLIAYAADDNPDSFGDCVIALRTFELAAQARNWGTCWAGFFKIAAENNQRVLDVLSLPAGHSLQHALMFGLPRFRFHRVPPRNRIDVRFL
ncbi:MAG: nitroreductase family protein [Negativicutes bacterium]|nr:nitroreductase family protein [Negativicutes bacterium]